MATFAGRLRVVIVSDDHLARAGIATLLADQPGCRVVGQFAGEADLSVELEAYRPDVVVWDLGWDPAAKLERLGELEGTGPPVVALLADEAHAAEALSAGARGLLLRSADANKLGAAVTAVAQGTVVVDRELATLVLSPGNRLSAVVTEGLTPRELEVLRLLAQGLPNKAIAHRLNISEHTVKFHVNAILAKLGAQSRTEAVIRATRLGLVLL